MPAVLHMFEHMGVSLVEQEAQASLSRNVQQISGRIEIVEGVMQTVNYSCTFSLVGGDSDRIK